MMSGIHCLTRKSAASAFVALIGLTLFLSACFSGNQDKQASAKKSAAEKSGAMDVAKLNLLTVPSNVAYDAVLDDLDKNDLQNINRALTLFINNKADSLSRDSMLVSFNEFMTGVLQGYYDSKLLGNKELLDHFRNRDDQSVAQTLTTSLSQHGINLTFREGDFYLEPDLNFVYKHLKGSLTASSRNYLETKIFLSGDSTGENPGSMAARVVAWEDFLLKNPGYLLKDDIQTQYLDALTAYLTGTEQAPLFDPNTNVLESKYQSSYLHFIESYPNRESAKIGKKFYELLTRKGFKYDEEIDSFLSEVNIAPIPKPQ